MTRAWSGRRVFELSLALLLLLAIAWVARMRTERPAKVAVPSMRVSAGLGDPLRGRILVEGDTVAFEARADEFWMVRPFHDRLDPFFMTELLRQAEMLQPIRVLPDTTGAPYGLEPPRGGVHFWFPGGQEWGIDVGDEVPAGGQRYARRTEPGSPVFLLEAYAAATYFAPAFGKLRDPVAASLRAGPPDSVAVLTPESEVRARRESKDRWESTVPADGSVDPVRINGVIQLLRGPNIREFVPPSASRDSLGLVRPRSTWILFQAARRETVRVGRPTPDGGVYILPAGRETPAVLPAEQYRSLVDGWPALADRRLFSVSRDSVDSIRFLDGEVVGYQRTNGGWCRWGTTESVSRSDALRTDLGNLLLLQWRSWPERRLRPPAGTERLRLVLTSPARADTLELAADRTGRVWARSTRQRRWGEVPETAWTIWSYRARHPE